MANGRQQVILHELTDEIVGNLQALAAEQRMPARDSDSSDDYMKETRQYVEKLRSIRDSLEEIFTGARI